MCTRQCPCNVIYQGGWKNYDEAELNSLGRTGWPGLGEKDSKGYVRMNWAISDYFDTFLQCSENL